MQKNRLEAAGLVESDHESNSPIQYVYRYAVVAGRDIWKWQQKGHSCGLPLTQSVKPLIE